MFKLHSDIIRIIIIVYFLSVQDLSDRIEEITYGASNIEKQYNLFIMQLCIYIIVYRSFRERYFTISPIFLLKIIF